MMKLPSLHRVLCAAIATGIVAWSGAALAFDLQGHRGARGLAPENTLVAFARALSIGVSTLELDLGMTSDGVLVVHHDIWLNPDTTRGPDGAFLASRGPAIRSVSLAELKRYDVGRIKPGTRYAETLAQQRPADGARIPTLAEVFDLARRAGARHVRFNIETKLTPASGADAPDPETFARAVATQVRNAGLAARVSVQSFDWRTLEVLRRIAPEIERVCLTSRQTNDATPQQVAAAGCKTWSPNFRDLTPELLAEAKALSLKIVAWTVNNRADMDRLIAMGVDGLISDYPDRLRAALGARGLPLPPPVGHR